MSAGAVSIHSPRRRGSKTPWALMAIVVVLLVSLLAGFVGAGGLGRGSGADTPSPELQDPVPGFGDLPGGLAPSRGNDCPQCR
jgi:hypothetical protein